MRKHLYYIDYLRFFAMTGVIYLHIASLLLNRGEIVFRSLDWEAVNFLQSFAYSAVAVFFMISGCLLLSDSRSSDVALLLKKRLPRLGIPLIAWTAAAAIWVGHLADDYSIGGFLERFVPGLYSPIMVHFWFAFSIIALYLVSPFLYAAIEGMGKIAHCLVFSLIVVYHVHFALSLLLPAEYFSYLNFELIGKLDPSEGVLSCFLLGWYLGNTEKRIPNTILLIASGLLSLIITLASRSYFSASGSYNVPFHEQTMGLQVMLASCIFLLFKQNILRPAALFSTFPILPLSYAIYFFHVIVMELFFGLGWLPSTFPGTLLFTAANLSFCYLLLKSAASFRISCYAATGISYADACRSCNWQHSISLLKEKLSNKV